MGGILTSSLSFHSSCTTDDCQDFLDELADDLDSNGAGAPPDGFHEQNTAGHGPKESPQAEGVLRLGQGFLHPGTDGQTIVRRVFVDVNIAPDHLAAADDSKSRMTKSKNSENKFHAEMTISIWTLSNGRHFTLTFTGISAAAQALSRTYSRSVIHRSRKSEQVPSTSAASSSQLITHSCPLCGSSCAQPKAFFSERQIRLSPSLQSIGASVVKPPLTDVGKVMRMQDSLIEAMELPVIAMWKDESVATVNRALRQLMYRGFDNHSTDAFEILSNFKAYTEDFQRELAKDEYPLVLVCRSQTSQTKFKIGLIDSNARRRSFELTVDSIFDDETGEFQAALTVLKDVSWYTDQIRAQGEQSEQQFQLICETLPQMVKYSRLMRDESIID